MDYYGSAVLAGAQIAQKELFIFSKSCLAEALCNPGAAWSPSRRAGRGTSIGGFTSLFLAPHINMLTERLTSPARTSSALSLQPLQHHRKNHQVIHTLQHGNRPHLLWKTTLDATRMFDLICNLGKFIHKTLVTCKAKIESTAKNDIVKANNQVITVLCNQTCGVTHRCSLCRLASLCVI